MLFCMFPACCSACCRRVLLLPQGQRPCSGSCRDSDPVAEAFVHANKLSFHADTAAYSDPAAARTSLLAMLLPRRKATRRRLEQAFLPCCYRGVHRPGGGPNKLSYHVATVAYTDPAVARTSFLAMLLPWRIPTRRRLEQAVLRCCYRRYRDPAAEAFLHSHPLSCHLDRSITLYTPLPNWTVITLKNQSATAGPHRSWGRGRLS